MYNNKAQIIFFVCLLTFMIMDNLFVYVVFIKIKEETKR